MSLESGRKSAAEMRAAQKDMIRMAESVQPTVAVTEKNWAAMIDSQKMQVKTMGEILEKLGALTTEEKMVAFMEMQLQVLRTDGKASAEAMEQYRQTLVQEAKNTTSSMEDTMKSLERQAGKMLEEFGNAISQEQERMKNTSKKLFWISMIPSLILVVWELTRHIWLLGCPISSMTALWRTAPRSTTARSGRSTTVSPWAECKQIHPGRGAGKPVPRPISISHEKAGGILFDQRIPQQQQPQPQKQENPTGKQRHEHSRLCD